MLLSLFREVAEEREDDAVFPWERFARIFESIEPLIAERMVGFLGDDPLDLFETMSQEAQKKPTRPLLLDEITDTLRTHAPA